MKSAIAAEFVGAMLLAAAVIGSGIKAERLSGGDAPVALLGNTLATVVVLPAPSWDTDFEEIPS